MTRYVLRPHLFIQACQQCLKVFSARIVVNRNTQPANARAVPNGWINLLRLERLIQLMHPFGIGKGLAGDNAGPQVGFFWCPDFNVTPSQFFNQKIAQADNVVNNVLPTKLIDVGQRFGQSPPFPVS